MRRLLSTTILLGGCALGVGPYQPGRASHAIAGDPGPDHDHEASDEAAKQRLPEIGGGTTSMYELDASYYAGMKQGISWVKQSTGWSKGYFFMEGHLGFYHTLADDHLLVGVAAFLAGYGVSDQGHAETAYMAGGGELALKLKLNDGWALRLAGAPTYGSLERQGSSSTMREHTGAWGARACVGLDWVWWRPFGTSDVVFSVEAQAVKSGTHTLLGMPTSFEGGALAFELTLAGF